MTSASASAGWLSQLAPAHALPPPGWWPLAPGWWLLASLLFVAITAFALFWLRPTPRHRRIALRDLRRLADTAGDDAALACGLEYLLRRYTLLTFGRYAVARYLTRPRLPYSNSCPPSVPI